MYTIALSKNENIISEMYLMILQFFKKYIYKIESIYMEVFIFCIHILQHFLSYEKLLKTHRILEKTALLR